MAPSYLPLIPVAGMQRSSDGRFRITFYPYKDPYNPWRTYAGWGETPEKTHKIQDIKDRLIPGVMREIWRAQLGEVAAVEMPRDVVVRDRTKTGKMLKNPVTEEEWELVEASGETGEANSRAALCRLLEEAAALQRSGSFDRRALRDRARFIRFMNMTNITGIEDDYGQLTLIERQDIPDTDPEPVSVEFRIVESERKRGSTDPKYEVRHKWSQTAVVPRNLRANLLDAEVMQFFTPGLLTEFHNKLDQFRWVSRKGFLEELECPKGYWELMRFRLGLIDLRDDIRLLQLGPNRSLAHGIEFVHGRVNEVLEPIYLHWVNNPIQPIKLVTTIGDDGERETFSPPAAWTFNDVRGYMGIDFEKISYDSTNSS